MSKLLRVCQMIEKVGTEELHASFVISIIPRGIIADNFREQEGREPDATDWEQIETDREILEEDVLMYLKNILGSVHNVHRNDDTIVGSFRCDWSNRKGLEIIQSNLESTGHQNLSREESTAFFKEVSQIGKAVLDVEFYFFDISEKEIERLGTALASKE